MNNNTDGLLARAVDAGIVDLVGINQTKFLQLHQQGSPLSGLDVKGLSACSLLIYASDRGVIVTHVGPNILGSQNPNSPLDLAHTLMDKVEARFNENRELFIGASRSWIVFATFQGNVTSPEQVQVLEERIRELPGADSAQIKYERRHPTEITDRGRYGTVWIDGRAPGFPQIYVEDQEVTGQVPTSRNEPTLAPAASQSASQSSASATVGTQWDGEYYVSTQNPAYVWLNGRWAPRPATTASQSRQQPSTSAPAGTQWDGEYYVSTQNPAYVWLNGQWTPRPNTTT